MNRESNTNLKYSIHKRKVIMTPINPGTGEQKDLAALSNPPNTIDSQDTLEVTEHLRELAVSTSFREIEQRLCEHIPNLGAQQDLSDRTASISTASDLTQYTINPEKPQNIDHTIVSDYIRQSKWLQLMLFLQEEKNKRYIDLSVTSSLLEGESRLPILYIAILSDEVKAAEILIRLGANIGQQTDHFKYNTLYFARNHPEFFEFLLKNLQLADLRSKAETDLSSDSEHRDEYSCILNAEYHDGTNILLLSAREGNTTIVNLLLQHPCINIQATDRQGNNLLHLYLHNKEYDLNFLKTLSIYKSTQPLFSQTNNQSESVLHIAIKTPKTYKEYDMIEGYDTLIRFCIHAGTDLNAQEKEGFSLLHYTVLHDNIVFCLRLSYQSFYLHNEKTQKIQKIELNRDLLGGPDQLTALDIAKMRQKEIFSKAILKTFHLPHALSSRKRHASI